MNRCCSECTFWDEERHKQEMNEWIKILEGQPRKAMFDFAKFHPKTHYPEHVPGPKDEEKWNK